MDNVKFGWIKNLGVVEFEMPELPEENDKNKKILTEYYDFLGHYFGVNATSLKNECQTYIASEDEYGYYLGTMGDAKIYVSNKDWKLTIEDEECMIYEQPEMTLEDFVNSCIDFYE